jgi:hypothetical protein
MPSRDINEVTRLETFINRFKVEHAADDAILRDEIKRTEQDVDAKILNFRSEMRYSQSCS